MSHTSRAYEELNDWPAEPDACVCVCVCVCVCSVVPLYLTLCDTMDSSPPRSSVHGIFQTRILEGVATSCSRGSSQPRDWTRVSFTGWQTLPPSHLGSPYRTWWTRKSLIISSETGPSLGLALPVSRTICSVWSRGHCRGQEYGVIYCYFCLQSIRWFHCVDLILCV